MVSDDRLPHPSEGEIVTYCRDRAAALTAIHPLSSLYGSPRIELYRPVEDECLHCSVFFGEQFIEDFEAENLV